MSILMFAALIYAAIEIAKYTKKQSAIREAERVRREQAELRRITALEREQARQAKEQERQRIEQERIAREQEKQAARLAKHEEMIRKLEMRMASAESELAFNREQRERLFKLLDIEERERDAAIEGSATWQKHQRKVISLESQIHTVQKRIDKAHMDKAYCESKIAS